MGGAVNDTFQKIAQPIAKIPVIGRAANNLLNVGTGFGLAAGIDRTAQGIKTLANAPRDAANQTAAAMGEQNRLAAAAEAKLALQPKQTASDNFLANKNKMLMNMRLGLQSSIAPTSAPLLSSPNLTGKSKLGA